MANVIVGGVEQAMLEQEFKNAANEDGKMTVSLTGLQIVFGAAGVGVEASRILAKVREKELVEGHCLELADFFGFLEVFGFMFRDAGSIIGRCPEHRCRRFMLRDIGSSNGRCPENLSTRMFAWDYCGGYCVRAS